MKYILYIVAFCTLLLHTGSTSYAQEQATNPTYQHGIVTDIIETTYPIMQGREIEFQNLEVELEDGSFNRNVYNDYTPVGVGDRVYLARSYNPATEQEGWFVEEIDRISAYWFIVALFVLLYVAVAGVKGLRSLFALVVAVLSVAFVLIPAMQSGYDPLLIGVGISALILGVAIFITHGFTVVSLVSYLGSMIAIGVTVGFAVWSFSIASISGFAGDQAMTLSLLYGPTLDLPRLLLAGIIIGILGVLDDVAVMQAAMVREFFLTSPASSFTDIFMRAMKVGREHAAALVNTLVLAYTAVALPIFLVVLSPTMQQGSDAVPLSMHLSNELFALEFIRSIVGSFGLVLTVPIVTLLAVLLYKRYPPQGEGPEVACMHHSH